MAGSSLTTATAVTDAQTPTALYNLSPELTTENLPLVEYAQTGFQKLRVSESRTSWVDICRYRGRLVLVVVRLGAG